jgi:hypothetical protein
MSNRAIVLERLLANEMLKMHPSDALGCAWEYFYAEPFTWYGYSEKLNQRTIVEYCYYDNHFGYPAGTVLHLTHNGEVYGTSETIQENGELFGTNPMFYYDHFPIDTQNFDLSFDQLREGKIRFVPKIEASALYNSMSKRI